MSKEIEKVIKVRRLEVLVVYPWQVSCFHSWVFRAWHSVSKGGGSLSGVRVFGMVFQLRVEVYTTLAPQ